MSSMDFAQHILMTELITITSYSRNDTHYDFQKPTQPLFSLRQ